MRSFAVILGLLSALPTNAAAGEPRAQARAAAPQGLPSGLAPFTHDAADDQTLAWARRWADANLDDPADRFAMLSYAVSAAQRRQIVARMNDGQDLSDATSGNILTEFTHLRHVGFLAELRTIAPPAGQASNGPEWNARHLCNGTLITLRWILTTAACASQPSAAQGIEARLGVQDLSQPGGIARRVTRIERNDKAGLALLELDVAVAAAGVAGDGAITIEPPAGLTPAVESIDYEEFLGLGYGRAALPGWPKVLYRHFSLFDRCPAGPGPCLAGDGLRFCAGDDGSPIYVYDLQQGPLLAGVLALPLRADRSCLEISESAATMAPFKDAPVEPSARPVAAAPVIAVARWSEWIDAITGVRSTTKKPRQITTFVPHEH